MAGPRAFTVERDVPVPMRDGVTLRADVFRPAGGGRHPALLQRNPYDKSVPSTVVGFILKALDRGYAVVTQDVRGRYASEGDFHPFFDERQDGYDTLDWLAGQPWCDGNIGMFNQSYLGLTQWQAALSGHPALKAIVPGVTADDYHDGWVYQGGAFELSFNYTWTMFNLLPDGIARRRAAGDEAAAADAIAIQDLQDATADGMARLPLAWNPLIARYAPYYAEWLAHPAYDEYWERIDVSGGYERLSIPTMSLGGWYDIFLKGTIGNFTGMRARAATAEAREHQRLIVGPWNHSGMRNGNPIGAVDFGVRSTGDAIDQEELHLRWYDRWLRGVDGGEDDPPVRIFVMGANRWRDEREWPLARTDYQRWYLHSGGRANSLRGDGTLGPETPGAEPPDTYVYNPLNPTPTMGGGLCCSHVYSQGGAYDQRDVEAREDVLVYTTPPLVEPVEVTGPVTMVLHATSSAPDTDFTAKLVDVSPCGFARNLTDGILRARYRTSAREPRLLTPGEPVELEIDMIATSNVFLPGHRIRVEIASSNFPRFDRNPNTGEVPGRGTEVVSALQTVLHSADHPSHLVLPVIPEDR